jgi:hypothetical protein
MELLPNTKCIKYIIVDFGDVGDFGDIAGVYGPIASLKTKAIYTLASWLNGYYGPPLNVPKVPNVPGYRIRKPGR